MCYIKRITTRKKIIKIPINKRFFSSFCSIYMHFFYYVLKNFSCIRKKMLLCKYVSFHREKKKMKIHKRNLNRFFCSINMYFRAIQKNLTWFFSRFSTLKIVNRAIDISKIWSPIIWLLPNQTKIVTFSQNFFNYLKSPNPISLLKYKRVYA